MSLCDHNTADGLVIAFHNHYHRLLHASRCANTYVGLMCMYIYRECPERNQPAT